LTTAQQVQWQEVRDIYSGQHAQSVVVGDYVVNIGEVQQGGIVNIAPPGKRVIDRIRPYSTRPYSVPRPVPGFLDREQELGMVGQALVRYQMVDLHGSDGMGKTALISQTLQTFPASGFPDGMVYVRAGHDGREDVLQELFEQFFETEGEVKVTENDVRRYMTGKKALIVIDDANHLGEREAEDLAGAVPHCAVLFAGLEQQAWQAVGVSLRGLPRAQAVELFERYWGPVSAEDRLTVEAICQALNDIPQSIVKTATIAKQRDVALATLQQQVQPRTEKPDPVGQAFLAIEGALSEGERCVLGALAAPGGQTVAVEALPTIADLPPEEANQHLNRLQKSGLVQADGSRTSLDDAFRPYARRHAADEEMRERAANYYLQKAAGLRAHSKDPDEENVMVALGHFYRRKRWKEVIAIARSAERYLATTGRWGQWHSWLKDAWRAAQELGDRVTEAWAQNQLGIIAMGLGDAATAATLFQGALHIWQVLGDQTGMTIARWNLQILLGPPPPPPLRAKPAGGVSVLLRILAIIAVVTVVTIITVLTIIIVLPPSSETPTPILPPTPTTPSRAPTITPTSTPTITPTSTPTITLTSTPSTPPSITPNVKPVCQCGDGYCEPSCDETEGSCPADCQPSTPPAPEPIEPIDDAELPCTSSPTYETFRWTAVGDPSGISGYIVALQQVPVGEGDVAETQTEMGNTTSLEMSLDCGRTYRWSVQARDGAGYLSVQSEWAVFSTVGPPPAPTALKPGSADSDFEQLLSRTVVLQWTEVSHPGGIETYEANLQDCGMDGASCSDYRTFSTAQTSHDISSEFPRLGGPYYRWNVRAIDYDGRASEPSSWLHFKAVCPTIYTVQPGDNLWTLAKEYLGDGLGYWDIVSATHGIEDPGSRFHDIRNPRLIRPGWQIFIPCADATAASS
jgi:hypothetical protein